MTATEKNAAQIAILRESYRAAYFVWANARKALRRAGVTAPLSPHAFRQAVDRVIAERRDSPDAPEPKPEELVDAAWDVADTQNERAADLEGHAYTY